VLYDARRRKFPIEPAQPLAHKLAASARALPALAVPAIVMIGIYGGLVTVTEAAALAAATSLIISLFVYRGFPWTRTLFVIAEAIRAAGSIMLIIATALAFGHWMAESGMPAKLVKFTKSITASPPGSSCSPSTSCCSCSAASSRSTRRSCS
jgi:C4-dicarboxylate transporter DctM subunit